jgi:hypothetical protein
MIKNNFTALKNYLDKKILCFLSGLARAQKILIPTHITHNIMDNSIRLFCLLIIVCSCNENKIVIPDIGRKIVINGLITDDAPLNVSISKSGYLTDLQGIDRLFLNKEDNVKVIVYENNIRIDSLTPEKYYEYDWFNVFNKGNFKSTSFLIPSSGKQYRIEVSGKDLPNASATMIIPDVVKIEQIDTSRFILTPGSYYSFNTGFLCRIVFIDPPERENFYMIRMFVLSYEEYPFDYLNPYYSDLLFSCSDPIIEENINNINGLQAVAFSDKLINGQKHYLDVVIKGEQFGEPLIRLVHLPNEYSAIRKTLYIKLYSITEEFFRYLQILQIYSRNYSNPLTEPVLMNSNVTGGYGMLSGASVSSDSIVFNIK